MRLGGPPCVGESAADEIRTDVQSQLSERVRRELDGL